MNGYGDGGVAAVLDVATERVVGKRIETSCAVATITSQVLAPEPGWPFGRGQAVEARVRSGPSSQQRLRQTREMCNILCNALAGVAVTLPLPARCGDREQVLKTGVPVRGPRVRIPASPLRQVVTLSDRKFHLLSLFAFSTSEPNWFFGRATPASGS